MTDKKRKSESGWNSTREKRRAAGYQRLEIWVKKEHFEKVKEVIKKVSNALKITE
jgi:nuclear transport factor 2 (NTF2) superfamily protein